MRRSHARRELVADIAVAGEPAIEIVDAGEDVRIVREPMFSVRIRHVDTVIPAFAFSGEL